MMATKRIRRILAAAEPRGDIGRLTQVLDLAQPTGADAIALLGDLTGNGDKKAYRDIFKALGAARLQTFWVPGPRDASFASYLRESYNLEAVFPFLHGVHGTIALSPDYVLFAGMGGEIVDDPETEREEQTALRYPGWEVEYRLKVIGALTHDYPRVFLFTTVPAHKGLDQPGSEVLAELIKTHSPRVALVAGGEGVRRELLANTLVVLPGSLGIGECAAVDLQDRTVEPVKLG
jgi:Icc-related predicted phosphoesterase